MVKIDIDYFKNETKSEITDELFKTLSREVYTHVNTLTFGKIVSKNEADLDAEVVKAVKSCECELLDYLTDLHVTGKKPSSSVISDIISQHLEVHGLTCCW